MDGEKCEKCEELKKQLEVEKARSAQFIYVIKRAMYILTRGK